MIAGRLASSLTIFALLPALVACGGGGGSSTPLNITPGALSDAGRAPAEAAGNLVSTAAGETQSVTLTGTFADPNDVPSNTTTSQSTGIGNGVSLVYDSASRSYTITLNQGGISDSMTYRDSDRDRTPDRAGFVEYERDAAGGDDTELFLRVPGAAGSNLSYVGYGIWNRESDQSGNTDFERWAMFVFGQRTLDSDVPTSGTARYNGTLDGLWTSASASYRLSGSAQLTADFGAGQVAGTLDINGRNRETGQTIAMDRLSGTAALDRGTAAFAGTMTGNSGFSGSWGGAFFGPQARETGGTFAVTRGAEKAVGVFTAGQ